MKHSIKTKTIMALGAAILAFSSCKKEDSGNELPEAAGGKEFQLAFASGSGLISGTYLQGVDDVSTGKISFDGKGSQISTGRTSRIFPSADGKYVYSLTYQQGTIDKWEFGGGSKYTKVQTIDSKVILKQQGIRFYKLNENEGSLHYISANPAFEADGKTYKYHEMKLTIGILDFNTMSIKDGHLEGVVFTLPTPLAGQGYNITRIDSPVLSNGKLYYGVALSKYNPATGKNLAVDKAMTLVVDYPKLGNPTVIETTLAVGSTNGYRTPTQHVMENGDVLQMVNGGGKTSIVKLINGQYDSSFIFKLDEALSRAGKTSSNGFFYVGNGIVYMPYEKRHLESEKWQVGTNPRGEPTYSYPWGIARIDLNSNSVVDLEVPSKLWLTQWQNSAVKKGKFYIALAPVGQAGHIYSFDINSTSPIGVKGSETVSGADQYFIGIY